MCTIVMYFVIELGGQNTSSCALHFTLSLPSRTELSSEGSHVIPGKLLIVVLAFLGCVQTAGLHLLFAQRRMEASK